MKQEYNNLNRLSLLGSVYCNSRKDHTGKYYTPEYLRRSWTQKIQTFKHLAKELDIDIGSIDLGAIDIDAKVEAEVQKIEEAIYVHKVVDPKRPVKRDFDSIGLAPSGWFYIIYDPVEQDKEGLPIFTKVGFTRNLKQRMGALRIKLGWDYLKQYAVFKTPAPEALESSVLVMLRECTGAEHREETFKISPCKAYEVARYVLARHPHVNVRADEEVFYGYN